MYELDTMDKAPTLVLNSSETKPTVTGGFAKPQKGTTLFEEDTGKVYNYVSATDTWREL